MRRKGLKARDVFHFAIYIIGYIAAYIYLIYIRATPNICEIYMKGTPSHCKLYTLCFD